MCSITAMRDKSLANFGAQPLGKSGVYKTLAREEDDKVSLLVSIRSADAAWRPAAGPEEYPLTIKEHHLRDPLEIKPS